MLKKFNEYIKESQYLADEEVAYLSYNDMGYNTAKEAKEAMEQNIRYTTGAYFDEPGETYGNVSLILDDVLENYKNFHTQEKDKRTD